MNKIISKEGYTLTNKDNTIFAKVIYLGKYDSLDNYYEILDEEAKELEKKLEDERN